VRIALPVDERQPHHPQAEPVAPVQVAQGGLGPHLGGGIGRLGPDLVVLAGGAATSRPVHQVGAGQDVALDTGRQRGAGQLDRGVVVDRQVLLVGDAAERGRQVDNRVDAVDRLLQRVRVAQVAGDHLGATAGQRLGAPGVARQDAHLLGLVEQPRDEAAADSSGRSGHEYAHGSTSRPCSSLGADLVSWLSLVDSRWLIVAG
jgi:hypothetical protein